jgi:hypothetical protein
MGKAATWHSASESEWALALRREAVIRSLAERDSLTPTTVLEAAQALNLSRSVTYDLLARYRLSELVSPWRSAFILVKTWDTVSCCLAIES